ncbi:alpha-N-arabinofuranosidase [Actinobaculum suis]|nr:alpha-L-arabinofuranosidase C-terminal domain-containing protein [Actinobaculum suis]KMY22582.1 alpha-N-arabinofuranosidase [Actinobaculum suis]SDE54991.1 alpha-N-arabinofuranosidase [Actinobaculum suis]
MAKLHVDPKYVNATINELIWGSFTEHLGRCIYGGLFQPDHKTADEKGLRQDVIDEINELGISLVRYPGGNFVSNYNWKDGIGPKEDRPRRLEFAWATIEPNQFGIDEFIDWARKANVEPMIAVNLGTGTPKEAAELVEYCNHPGGTYWSDLRRKNGHEEPYGIKYWCLGNEMEGDWQAGHLSAENYADKALEAAKMMRWVDRDIKLVACGSSYHVLPEYLEWDRIVLNKLYSQIDYLSTHFYASRGGSEASEFIYAWHALDEHLSNSEAVLDFVKGKRGETKDIPVCLDEWNVWNFSDLKIDGPDDLLGATELEVTSAERWEEAPPILQEKYTLLDALTFAGLGMTLINHADRVEIACLAQLVNAIAPITTSEEGGILRQAIWYPLREFTQRGRGEVLDYRLECTKVTVNEREIPTVYAAVVRNPETRELTIFVLNANLDESVPLEIQVSGHDFKITGVRRLEGEKLNSVNTFENPNEISMKEMGSRDQSGVDLPPASFSVVTVGVAE